MIVVSTTLPPKPRIDVSVELVRGEHSVVIRLWRDIGGGEELFDGQECAIAAVAGGSDNAAFWRAASAFEHRFGVAVPVPTWAYAEVPSS